MATLIQIDEDRVRLSAAGLFNVGMFLIPGVSLFLFFKFSSITYIITYI
jgi:hypothetical protein